MYKRAAGAIGALALVVVLGLTSAAAGAATASPRHDSRHHRAATTELSVVRRHPNLPVTSTW